MRGCHVTSVSHYTVLPPKTIHTKSKFLNFEKKKKKQKKIKPNKEKQKTNKKRADFTKLQNAATSKKKENKQTK